MAIATEYVTHMRKVLQAERGSLVAQATVLAGRTQGVSDERATEDADAATALYDRELALWLEHNARSHLNEVDAAVARLGQGRYGICEDCHEEIGQERLRALPRASRCVSCQRRVEHQAKRSPSINPGPLPR